MVLPFDPSLHAEPVSSEDVGGGNPYWTVQQIAPYRRHDCGSGSSFDFCLDCGSSCLVCYTALFRDIHDHGRCMDA